MIWILKDFNKKLKKVKKDTLNRRTILYTQENPYIKKENLELKESFKEKSKKSVKTFRDWI